MSHWSSPPVWTAMLVAIGVARYYLVSWVVTKHQGSQVQLAQEAQWTFLFACSLVEYSDPMVSVVLGTLPLVSPYNYSMQHPGVAAAVILRGVSTTTAGTKIKTTLDPDYAQTQPPEPTFSACMSHWSAPPVWTSLLAARGLARHFLVAWVVNQHLESAAQVPQDLQWSFLVACALVKYTDPAISVVLGALPLVSPYNYSRPHSIMAAAVILGGVVTTAAATTIKTTLDPTYTETITRMLIAVLVVKLPAAVIAVILGAIKDNLRPDWNLWGQVNFVHCERCLTAIQIAFGVLFTSDLYQ